MRPPARPGRSGLDIIAAVAGFMMGFGCGCGRRGFISPDQAVFLKAEIFSLPDANMPVALGRLQIDTLFIQKAKGCAT
jgi:hypothetical protein